MPSVTVIGEPVRRRIGTALLVGVALVPLAVVVALAASSRGLFGRDLPRLAVAGQHPQRRPRHLRPAHSARARAGPLYWHQALDVGSHALLKGVGELGYGVARLRYTTSPVKADQAHSYLFQTFADLGLIGVALTFALLAAWAARRPARWPFGTRWRSLDRRASEPSARD